MSTNDSAEEFVPTSLNAVVDGVDGVSTPVKVSFRPYGNQTCGTQEEGKPEYRYIEGEIKGVEGYSHIKTDDDQWYIIANGEAFAPTHEEWLGKEVTNKIDPEDLPSPPLADQSLVLGKRAPDNNGYIAVGVDIVILRPTVVSPQTTTHETQQYEYKGVNENATAPSDHITNVRSVLGKFEENTQEEAIEAINNAITELEGAKMRLQNINPPSDGPKLSHKSAN